MAAATALLAARSGRRVLLIEVDAKGDVPAQFEQKAVGFTPAEVYPGINAMAMDTEASLREYLRVSMRMPVIGRLGPLAHVLDFVAKRPRGSRRSSRSGRYVGGPRIDRGSRRLRHRRGRRGRDRVTSSRSSVAADAIQELVDVGPGLRHQTSGSRSSSPTRT